MAKQLFLKKYAVVYLIALIISGSCNNEKGNEKSTATEPGTGDAGKTVKEASPPAAGLSSGRLDTLYISATEFKLLDKNKAEFIFYFGTNDTISLDGWKDKGGTFNTPPDVRLLKDQPDATLTYGPGTYFGNLVLNNVNQLINKINANQATYVIFAPQKTGNHVWYKIFLSKETKMVSPKTLAIIPTGDEANPSPPKPS